MGRTFANSTLAARDTQWQGYREAGFRDFRKAAVFATRLLARGRWKPPRIPAMRASPQTAWAWETMLQMPLWEQPVTMKSPSGVLQARAVSSVSRSGCS